MQKITRINLESLRNETHVELNENVVRLIEKYKAADLDIALLYDVYKQLYDAEVLLLDIIRRSEFTTEIDNQDDIRDSAYRGFSDSVKSSLNHFDPVKRQAAEHVHIALDHYGNIASKTYDDESAAIDDLARELSEGNYQKSITTLGLADWLEHLIEENKIFKDLMALRYEEASKRPNARMKSLRLDTNKALRDIMNQIEALMLVNGETKYAGFTSELNAVMERYKNLLAQERGRRAKKND